MTEVRVGRFTRHLPGAGGSFGTRRLLGGVRIYDDPPQAASYPFITFGQSLVRD